jgi:thymidylate synthase (FAD)
MVVDLIDHMGTDLTVVNSARVSFNKQSSWEYTQYGRPVPREWWGGPHSEKALSDKDQRLIKYLAKHNHWTPFSHAQITMREKVPLFVARQRFKHTVGFTYNERSGRYVGNDVEFFSPTEWRRQSADKKQGSSDEKITHIRYWDPIVGPGPEWIELNEILARHHFDCECLYNSMVNDGVAIEQARMVLPQSMYTEYYVTGSLAAWGRAYTLRSAPDAQVEIRDLADQWDKIIKGIPELKHSWDALTQRDATTS